LSPPELVPSNVADFLSEVGTAVTKVELEGLSGRAGAIV
jgi:hypothetical protein